MFSEPENQVEKPVICFEKYGKCYPIEVFNLMKLYNYNLIGVTKFEKEMRKYGITRGRAHNLMGLYKFGEYYIKLPDGQVIRGEPKATWFVVKNYSFTWVIKLKYDKRKSHEIFLDVEVTGHFQKRDAIPVPSEDSLELAIDGYMDFYFNRYVKDFWNFRLEDLRKIAEAEYETGIERLEVTGYDVIGEGKQLECGIDDITFLLSRKEDETPRNRPEYARDFWPYAEAAVNSVLEFIWSNELDWLRKESEKAKKSIERKIKKTIEKFSIEKIQRMIEISRTLRQIDIVNKEIETAYSKGYVDYVTYLTLYETMLRKAKEIAYKYASKYCELIKKQDKVWEVNRILSKITKTKVWSSGYFEELKKFVLDCASNRIREILRKEVKEKKISRETVIKRVKSYYSNLIKDFEENGVKSPTSVRDLSRLIRRIERSSLPDELKRELIERAEKVMNKIAEEKCETTRKTIKRIIESKMTPVEKIEALRTVKAEISTKSRELYPCYKEISETIKNAIKEMIKDKYFVTVYGILSELKSAKKDERVDILLENSYTIIKLPPDKQINLISELIDIAETIPELEVIHRIISNSPISSNPIYSEKVKELMDRIKEKWWYLE